MKKITAPQKIKKSYLDTLTYDQIMNNISRSICQASAYGKFYGTKRERFYNEIDNYIRLRFTDRTKKTVKAVAKEFRERRTKNKNSDLANFNHLYKLLMTSYRRQEQSYHFITLD